MHVFHNIYKDMMYLLKVPGEGSSVQHHKMFQHKMFQEEKYENIRKYEKFP